MRPSRIEDRPELVMNTGIERVLGEFAARQFAEAFVTISHHLRSLQLLLGLIQLSLLLERLKQQPVTLIIVGQLDDRALQRQLRFLASSLR